MASEHNTYHPRDAVSATIRTTAVATGVGAIFAGVQNTLAKQNLGAMGIFTRFGGTVAVFATVGGVYQFTRIASANLREKDDSYNAAIGGALAGAAGGLYSRRLPVVLGMGAALAVGQSVFDYTGGSLFGKDAAPEQDRVAMREAMRRNRRRPLEETVAELGEGRGIYAPGYEERRRERLKEKYGIDFTGIPSSH